MKSKMLIFIGIVSALIIGTISYMLLLPQQNKNPDTSVNDSAGKIMPTSVPTAEQTKTWEDPAGFSFPYQASLLVNNHEEDNENYAHVEMTKTGIPGQVIVWASDTSSRDVAQWVAKTPEFAGLPVIDTTLGGQPAKKIMITNPTKRMIIGAIYDGLLFKVEAENGGEADTWFSIAQNIAAGFSFTESQSPQVPLGTGNDEYSDEEVVE